MGNTYMPKPENRYPNNVSGFEHIWELDMLNNMNKLIYSLFFVIKISRNCTTEVIFNPVLPQKQYLQRTGHIFLRHASSYLYSLPT